MFSITPDIMGSSEYVLDFCIAELVRKSFLEQVKPVDFLFTKPTMIEYYGFHALIAGYLNIISQEYNCTKEFQGYWKKYFDKINFPPNDIRISYQTWNVSFPNPFVTSYSFEPRYVHNADFKCFTDILVANNSHSYHLASFLISNSTSSLVGIKKYSKNYDMLIHSAVMLLIKDIRLNEDVPPVAAIHVSRLIAVYVSLFFNKEYVQYLNYSNKMNLMDDLLKCEKKIDRLLSPITGNHNQSSREIAVQVLIDRSYFHLNVDYQCQMILNQHEICHHRWKYRLLAIHRDLSNRKKNHHLRKGLLYYALMEHGKAISQLQLAIEYQCCFKELQNGIAHMALYDIHSRNNETKRAQLIRDEINKTYTLSASAELSSAYGYVVIPFLLSVNLTDAAANLCNKWVKNYCDDTTSFKCDPYNLHQYLSQGEIFSYSFCPKPQNCTICCEEPYLRQRNLRLFNMEGVSYIDKGEIYDSSDLLSYNNFYEKFIKV